MLLTKNPSSGMTAGGRIRLLPVVYCLGTAVTTQQSVVFWIYPTRFNHRGRTDDAVSVDSHFRLSAVAVLARLVVRDPNRVAERRSRHRGLALE